jgi:hypothetical protein
MCLQAFDLFPMSDILNDLRSWLTQLCADAPHRERAGEMPKVEINLVRRAIEEIERLRALEETTRPPSS